MRTDDPKLPDYVNSTMADRKAEREKAKGQKKAVQTAENKAVKSSSSK